MMQSRRTIAQANRDIAITKRLERAASGLQRIPATPLPMFRERFAEGYLGQLGRVAITELTAETCRWPIDQPKAAVRYCGDTVSLGSVYCEHHRGRSLGRWT